MDREYRDLLSLLDDENDQAASLAMAELLSRDEKQLEPVLRKLQESSDPRLRKRIHQLQSTMTLRNRRKHLMQQLSAPEPDLRNGLILLHLLWFDNDSPVELRKQCDAFLAESDNLQPDSLELLGMFMRRRQFQCAGKDDYSPERLCMGTVLDSGAGADFILCALGALVSEKWGLPVGITQSAESDFILVDRFQNVLIPANDWEFLPSDGKKYSFEFWNSEKLIRYAASLLFVCAVSSDSFRYIFTTGSCLSGKSSTEFLPYPYGK